jgi:hypothetical protein
VLFICCSLSLIIIWRFWLNALTNFNGICWFHLERFQKPYPAITRLINTDYQQIRLYTHSQFGIILHFRECELKIRKSFVSEWFFIKKSLKINLIQVWILCRRDFAGEYPYTEKKISFCDNKKMSRPITIYL